MKKTKNLIATLLLLSMSVNEAKALLNEFGVSKDEITVIPVIQPISSYEYEIDDEYRERVNKLFE